MKLKLITIVNLQQTSRKQNTDGNNNKSTEICGQFVNKPKRNYFKMILMISKVRPQKRKISSLCYKSNHRIVIG